MSAQYHNWLAHPPRFNALYGAIPEPGQTWQCQDCAFDDVSCDQKRGYLLALDDRGLISRTGRDNEGTIWETNRNFDRLMQSVCERKGVNPDDAFIPHPQARLGDFAKANG